MADKVRRTAARVRRMSMKVRRITAEHRLEDLRSFVWLCFQSLDEDDDKEISNLTGLSVSTIYRLRKGAISLKVEFDTIDKLGRSAGFKLEGSEERGYRMMLID